MSKYWSKLCCLKGGGSSTDEFWRQKTRVPGLSRSVVCVIIRLAVLIQYRRVTQTHTQTNTRLAVLHNPWRFGGALFGRHLVRVWSVNLQKRSTYTFQSFCLKVDFVCLLTIRLKLDIVPTREITTKKILFFLVDGRGPIYWMGLMLQHQQHPP